LRLCINFYCLFFWQLNLLVATKVGEEGLDIQTCCLVIRFDLPETVSSFIQSRGRARMPQSEYAFLVNRCFYKACVVCNSIHLVLFLLPHGSNCH
jgi:hypothetical protein